MNKHLIKKLIFLIIFANVTIKSFAGSWNGDLLGTYYLDDNGNRVTKQWRWIDSDNNGIAECFRFDENGYLVKNQIINGKFKVNEFGQWYDQFGIVKVYTQSKRRIFDSDNDVKVPLPPKVRKISTISVPNRSKASPSNASPSYIVIIEEEEPEAFINTTKKKIFKGEDSNERVNLVGPKGQAPKKASASAPSLRIISKGTDLLKKMKEVPTAKYENVGSIDTVAMEEQREIKLHGRVQPGKNLKNFVNVSTKFTKDIASTKIFGGSTWKDCMLLSGNEAYVKFDVKGYNYLTVEVAEQSHVVSDDNETYTYLEVFENGESIGTYDGFNDSDPETIEIYFDESETKTIAFKLYVSGTYTTRKVYMRNGRLRRLRDFTESEYNVVKTELNEFGVLVKSTETAPAYDPFADYESTTEEEEETTSKRKVKSVRKTTASSEKDKESESKNNDAEQTSETAKEADNTSESTNKKDTINKKDSK